MAFDDRPMYEINGSTITPIKPKWGARAHETALYPSQLYLWFHEEQGKQRRGLRNELDDNQIAAAIRGVKNKWFNVVQKEVKVFEDYISFKKFELWDDIKRIRDGTYEKNTEHIKELSTPL